ncbi:hypothetical protein GF362_03205 [Candidatus Dojkabacteria bacterium]|nr:hypothetical protein [Candidatus Dojkabacteria bacterium]
MLRKPEMDIKEKRFIKQGQLIDTTGEYYPSLTFRGNGKLYIEFSAPKILFENNVEELSNEDFDDFIGNFTKKLYDMGINISNEALKNSYVSFATVSKNIILDGPVGATEFIEFTRRLWWKWRHSLKFENYKENGVSIREFTTSTGIGIYAKAPSLVAINHKTDKEKGLVQNLKQNNILRFEYRMQNYQRTNAKYSWALGRKVERLTLKDIFDSGLSKKILLYDLNKSLFSDEFKFIPMRLPTIKRMYEYIWDQDIKPSEEWAIITCFRLCSDLGIHKAKEIFENRYSNTTTKRVWKLCKKVLKEFDDYEYSNIRNEINAQISEFKSITNELLSEEKMNTEKCQINLV